MDEKCLFYVWEQIIHLLLSNWKDGRRPMRELLITVCCNGDDSDKVPLSITGKYPNLRYFKDVKISNLNIHYRANK